MNALSDLFPKARGEILRLLFDDPAKEPHLRVPARLTGLTAAALQRDLLSRYRTKIVEILLLAPPAQQSRA